MKKESLNITGNDLEQIFTSFLNIYFPLKSIYYLECFKLYSKHSFTTIIYNYNINTNNYNVSRLKNMVDHAFGWSSVRDKYRNNTGVDLSWGNIHDIWKPFIHSQFKEEFPILRNYKDNINKFPLIKV